MGHQSRLRAERRSLEVLQPKDQPCDGCNACCHSIGVHELNKPIHTACQHQVNGGCGIYGQHPPSCKSYWCYYSGGFFGETKLLRPDKLGIIFDARTDNPDTMMGGWEVWAGAADSSMAQTVIGSFATRMIVYIRRYNSTKRLVFGPPHLLAGTTFREDS